MSTLLLFIDSQELLAAVEREKSARRRHVTATGPSYPRHYQEVDSEYVSYMFLCLRMNRFLLLNYM